MLNDQTSDTGNTSNMSPTILEKHSFPFKCVGRAQCSEIWGNKAQPWAGVLVRSVGNTPITGLPRILLVHHPRLVCVNGVLTHCLKAPAWAR